ncbi:MAG TPA: outer membrane lipoprotein-sorting protein [Thermoanaerobaculia bacterium]|nr:outer membrane lipoprotein-sorting protein [Thermoanaerobaculia bacterium]
MRKRSFVTLAVALLFAVSAFADLTVDEILAKNFEARGGADKWKALQSMRFTGKMSMGGGMEAPISMTKKRPEMMRLDFTIQGMTGTQAYDGTTGWMLMPFLGKKDAEPVSADMLKEVKLQADFDGPTWDYKTKGHTIELLGKADIEGTPAYKLKLVTKEGIESVIYIDAENFLEIKAESKAKVQGQEVESETTFGNYQEVDGLLFPFSIEMKPKGAPTGQSITIEKVELNPTIADDTFKMPVKKAEAAPAAPKQ